MTPTAPATTVKFDGTDTLTVAAPSLFDNPYQFTGRRFDPETGLQFSRMRYYNAQTGLWLSRDPIGFAGGINLYGYVGASPTHFVDPMGLLGVTDQNTLDALAALGIESPKRDPEEFWNDAANCSNRARNIVTNAKIAGIYADAATQSLGQTAAVVRTVVGEIENGLVCKPASALQTACANLTTDPKAPMSLRAIGALYGMGSSLFVKENLWKTELTLTGGLAALKLAAARNAADLAAKNAARAGEECAQNTAIKNADDLVSCPPSKPTSLVDPPKSTDTKVIGRLDDTAVAKDWDGHDVLDIPDWTMEKNNEWVDIGIQNQQPFYLGSPEAGNMIQTSGRFSGQPTIFAMEIQRLIEAGYIKIGNYYIHPGNVTIFRP